jgi:DNA-binding NarL/FixJ family response regulator
MSTIRFVQRLVPHIDTPNKLCNFCQTCHNGDMENELRTNAVRLSPEQQYEIRKGIIRLYKKGKDIKEIAEMLDVSERHVYNTKKLYAEQGMAGIKPKTRGATQR